MLRLCYAAPPELDSAQKKTPAAVRQTRERVGNEENSVDALTNDENGAKHVATIVPSAATSQR